MRTDFLDASERHWVDAERLFEARRWANADHLYGMSAECGLKRLMQAFGMTVDPTSGSPVDRKDQRHAKEIWVRYEGYRSGRMAGTDYALPYTNPFDNWAVSDRYANQLNFREGYVRAHQAGAKVVQDLIKRAQREGVL